MCRLDGSQQARERRTLRPVVIIFSSLLLCAAAPPPIDMSWAGAPAVLDDSPPAVRSSRRLTCARRKDHQTVAKLVRHPPNKNLSADVGELSNKRQLLLNLF